MNRIRVFTRADILLLPLMIVAVVYGYALTLQSGGGEGTVVVERDGVMLRLLPLGEEAQVRLDEFDPPVVLEVVAGTIRVMETGCRQQICRRSGAISKPGEAIACVPNKLLIYVRREHNGREPVRITTG